MLSLTGGNPANEFNGTGFSMSHGIVDVNGTINTGIASNVNVTFNEDASGNITATFGTGSPQLTWLLETEEEQSGLVTEYQSLVQQLNTYLAMQQALKDAATFTPQHQLQQ